MIVDTILKSGRDSMLIAVPCIAMLFVGLFRLDELIEKPRRNAKRRTLHGPMYGTMRGLDQKQEPIFSDPDGRVPDPE